MSSENEYKETKGTKKETNMRNSERNQTSRERGSVFRVIFCSIFMEGTGALAVVLCILNIFLFYELSISLSLSKFFVISDLRLCFEMRIRVLPGPLVPKQQTL